VSVEIYLFIFLNWSFEPDAYKSVVCFQNWKEMEYAIIQLLVFLLLAGVDIGTAVYDRYWRHAQQNIGYVAHLAGAVAGKTPHFTRVPCHT
jgi:hypothetical protein